MPRVRAGVGAAMNDARTTQEKEDSKTGRVAARATARAAVQAAERAARARRRSGSHRRYGERRSRGGGDRLRLRLRLRRYDCGLRSPLNAPFPCQVRMGGARRKAAAERERRADDDNRAGVYGVSAPAIGWWAAAAAAARRGARAGAAARRAGAGAGVFGSEVRLRLCRALLVARATQRLLLSCTLDFRGAQLVCLFLRVLGDCAMSRPPSSHVTSFPPPSPQRLCPHVRATGCLYNVPVFDIDPKRTGRCADALCLFSLAAVRRLRRSMGVSFFGASAAGNPADIRTAGRTPAPGGRLASPPPPPRFPPAYGSAAGSRCSASKMGCSRCLP
jgi:hypothetical protein